MGGSRLVSPDRQSIAGLLVLISAFLFVRLYVAAHDTLWTDEIWSICTSTGHSLDCLWERSDKSAALGDYVEPEGPVPASYYQKYLDFDERCKLPDNIIRACLRGDWNSPVFYLLLCMWLKVVGVSDLTARLLSIIFSLAAMPFIWLVAKELGGKKAALWSSLLYTFAPISIFYSTDVRHYALAIFLSALLVWLTLVVTWQDNRRRKSHMVQWTIVAGCGMLSTILYLGTFASCAIWLFFHRRLLLLKNVVLMLVGACAIALLWHATIPYVYGTNLAPNYLSKPLPWLFAPSRPICHLLAFFPSCGIPISSSYSLPGIVSSMVFLALIPVIVPLFSKQTNNRMFVIANLIAVFLSGAVELLIFTGDYPQELRPAAYLTAFLSAVVLFVLVFIFAKRKNFAEPGNFDVRARLLYLNLFLACILPSVFDIVRSAHTAINHRYALVCLPIAFVLGGLALSKCKPLTQGIFCLIAFCIWLPIYGQFFLGEGVMGEDYKAMAQVLKAAKKSDMIIVIGTFSTVVPAVAHYLPPDTNIVGRFTESPQRKQPSDYGDILTMMKGKTGVYLVKTYWTIPYSGIEELLRQNAKLAETYVLNAVPEKQWSFRESILYFVPRDGDVF